MEALIKFNLGSHGFAVEFHELLSLNTDSIHCRYSTIVILIVVLTPCSLLSRHCYFRRSAICYVDNLCNRYNIIIVRGKLSLLKSETQSEIVYLKLLLNDHY